MPLKAVNAFAVLWAPRRPRSPDPWRRRSEVSQKVRLIKLVRVQPGRSSSRDRSVDRSENEDDALMRGSATERPPLSSAALDRETGGQSKRTLLSRSVSAVALPALSLCPLPPPLSPRLEASQQWHLRPWGYPPWQLGADATRSRRVVWGRSDFAGCAGCKVRAMGRCRLGSPPSGIYLLKNRSRVDRLPIWSMFWRLSFERRGKESWEL